jgi:hypothetical protein
MLLNKLVEGDEGVLLNGKKFKLLLLEGVEDVDGIDGEVKRVGPSGLLKGFGEVGLDKGLLAIGLNVETLFGC